MVSTAIAIVVSMVVAPGPVFFLFFGRNLTKVASGIPMSFIGPLPVEDHFVIVPDVIVGVVGVVDAVVMVVLRTGQTRPGQCGSQEKRDKGLETETHGLPPKVLVAWAREGVAGQTCTGVRGRLAGGLADMRIGAAS